MPTLPSRPALAVVPPTEKRAGKRLTEGIGKILQGLAKVRLCWLLRALALITSYDGGRSSAACSWQNGSR